MSKDYFYDPITKDLTLTDLKDLKFTEDISEYTSQKIEKKLSFMLGEWFLNVEEGIPYIAQNNNDRDDNTKNFFVKNPNLAWINGIYILNLNEISTIDSIIKLETTLNTTSRTLNVDFEVKLINGEGLSGSVPISPF